jgi:Domain of unknown function (DUF1996)
MKAPSRPLTAGLIAIGMLLGLVALDGPGAAATSGPVGHSKGAFIADCSLSHRRSDDPIVFPRGPGQSHRHDFFGNRSTDAFTTPDSLRKARTNCVRTNTPAKDVDRSAYWVPTLYVGTIPIPGKLGAYYTTGFRRMRTIQPFPERLRVIAGDSKGKQPYGYFWNCEGATIAPGTATVAPTCGRGLDVTIRFPDCWDGTHLDSRDHKSHMAYSTQARQGAPTRVCPSTHPRQMPQLTLIVKYPTVGGPAVRLASGALNTSHADFMNGWDQRKLTALVRDCLRKDKYCGGGDQPVPGHQ